MLQNVFTKKRYKMAVDKIKASNKLVSFLLAPDFYSSPFYEDYRLYNGHLIIEYIKKNIPFNDLDGVDFDFYLTLLKTILNDVQPQQGYSWTNNEIKIGDMYVIYERARESYQSVFDAIQQLQEKIKEV